MVIDYVCSYLGVGLGVGLGIGLGIYCINNKVFWHYLKHLHLHVYENLDKVF